MTIYIKYLSAPIAILILAFVLFGGEKTQSERAEAKIGDIYLIVAARGGVEAAQEADLAPKSLGRIKEIRVNEGDSVQKDEIIATLENDEIKASVEQARASLLRTDIEIKEAAQSLARIRAVFEKGVISKSELDSSQLKYDVASAVKRKAEADLQQARAVLESTYVRAPFAGTITRKFLDPGETITLEKLRPIVTLSDMSQIIIRAEIDETKISKIRLGQSCAVTSKVYPGEEFAGRVVEISPAVGKKTLISDNPAEMIDRDVLETKIELGAEGRKLNLGLEVDVKIIVNDRRDVLIVPRKFVAAAGGKSTVRVKVNGSYEEREIGLGLSDEENVEVLSGLKEGDILAQPDESLAPKSLSSSILGFFSR
ncbi:MAG: efflux RND transporter periplasmic adaptor subunit [Deltaproteobacteria bacterium]